MHISDISIPNQIQQPSLQKSIQQAFASQTDTSGNIQKSTHFADVLFESVNRNVEEKLTQFFNATHSNSNFVIDGDVVTGSDSNALLPENQRLKNEIESQIDKIFEEENVSPFTIPSSECLENVAPLWQKLNAIAALGDTMIITDTVLQNSAAYLQNLEDTWSAGKDLDMSLNGRFQAAVKNFNDAQNTHMSAEEKARKITEEAIEDIIL